MYDRDSNPTSLVKESIATTTRKNYTFAPTTRRSYDNVSSDTAEKRQPTFNNNLTYHNTTDNTINRSLI